MRLTLNSAIDNMKDIILHFTPSLAPGPQKKPRLAHAIPFVSGSVQWYLFFI